MNSHAPYTETLTFLIPLFDIPLSDIPDFLRDIEVITRMLGKIGVHSIFIVLTDPVRGRFIEHTLEESSKRRVSLIVLHEYENESSCPFDYFLRQCLEGDADVFCWARFRHMPRYRSRSGTCSTPFRQWLWNKIKRLFLERGEGRKSNLVALDITGRGILTIACDSLPGRPRVLFDHFRNKEEFPKNLLRHDLFIIRLGLLRSKLPEKFQSD
jgi:hypothetical protein